MIEVLSLKSQEGNVHCIETEILTEECSISLNAKYISGCFDIPSDTQIVSWTAEFDSPDREVEWGGHAHINRGRIEIPFKELRGFGLGSLLMRPLIIWIKQRPAVPMVQICLAGNDASTHKDMNIRNRFYEKLGFTFVYEDEGAWGISNRPLNHDLNTPPFRLGKNWTVDSAAGKDSLFI